MPHSRTNFPSRLFVVSLCLGGAWISAELLKVHAGPWPSLKKTLSTPSWMCSSGPDGDSGCAAVLQSDYSAIGFDVPIVTSSLSLERRHVEIPVAFMGLAYFVFLGVWFTLTGPPRDWPYGLHLVPLVAVSAAAMVSLGLVFIMFLKMDARCPWCSVIHGVNGLLLVTVWRIWLQAQERDVSMVTGDSGLTRLRAIYDSMTRGVGARAICAALVVIVGLWLYRDAKLETRRQVTKLLPYARFVEDRISNPEFLVREFQAQPERLALRKSALGIGKSRLPEPSLVVFSDFECPHCACFAAKWKKELRQCWRGPIHVEFRHLPLDRSCNTQLRVGPHAHACEAGFAAEAARLQGGEDAFWGMHDQLFAAYRILHLTPYADLAEQIGLNGALLAADMQGETVRRRIADDLALADALGVRSTPAVFLNGRRIPSYYLHNKLFWESISAHLVDNACVSDSVVADALSTDGFERTALARFEEASP